MQSADANLLLALDALLREGSVTGAAHRLHVSPPAMSHTLARLRAAVGDPLFVRSGNRLVPTPRALAMRERVAHVANEIGDLLRPEEPLDMATLDRTFVIRASDAVIVPLGRALDGLARREAPRVALRFVASAEGIEIDLDIGVQHGRSPDVRIQRLYRDELVPVVRKDHPWGKRRIAPERLAALEYVAAWSKTRVHEAIRPSRHHPFPSRIVPSYLVAVSLVRESDAYTVLPSRLAPMVLESFGLRRLSVTGTPATITIAQAWSPRFDNDAGHTWLRGCVHRACGSFSAV